MESFWPFSKPVWELDENDLCELKGKVETWYIEYKGPQTLEQPSDLAKAVASFANKYGGWLLLGIEAHETTNEPILPPEGIPPAPGLTEKVYQAIRGHLSPPPSPQVQEIVLNNDNSVLAVLVPESENPPHIHMRTGSVFVRTGNTSQPLDRIKDRQELDALYQKAESNRGRVRELLCRAPIQGETALFCVIAPLATDMSLFRPPVVRFSGSGTTTLLDPPEFMRASSVQVERPEEWQYGVSFYAHTQSAAFLTACALTTYGHIEAAWLLPDKNAATVQVPSLLPCVFSEASKQYSKVGYFGRVAVLVGLYEPQCKDKPLTAKVTLKTDVYSLESFDPTEIAHELSRAVEHPGEFRGRDPNWP